ncbi:MAG: 16S rRNA (cytosine(1402)-N(4))-methyltransferase RsmH [bacterium]|nr:16S rRNA (cytosine(1402)-N(4))-methyltransferase RsmH [bacterium]
MSGPHVPVMPGEVLRFLRPERGMVVVDATVGCGGHAAAIAARIMPGGVLVGIDWDDAALEVARRAIGVAGWDVRLRRRNFAEIGNVLAEEGLERADAVLFDLGVSGLQLGSAARGFSFAAAGPLDMRMDRRRALTAASILGRSRPGELERVFRLYGEEPLARPIARAVARRGVPPDTSGLAALVRGVYARAGMRPRRTDPSTRVFQALRIAVNDELENLRAALPAAVGALARGGRIVVISFHSLEDRIVKGTFAREAKGCVCPPDAPACGCGGTPRLVPLTKRPVRPTEEEVARNPRSRSARLRAAERT